MLQTCTDVTTSVPDKTHTSAQRGVVRGRASRWHWSALGGDKHLRADDWDWRVPRPGQTKDGFLEELKVAWHAERGSMTSEPRHSDHKKLGTGLRVGEVKAGKFPWHFLDQTPGTPTAQGQGSSPDLVLYMSLSMPQWKTSRVRI